MQNKEVNLSGIDQYIQNLYIKDQDPTHESLIELPDISVSPNEGKLLYLLAKISKARRILEIGTLGGYSSIWLAMALPENGSLLSLEIDPDFAEIARRNIDSQGLSSKTKVVVADALLYLNTLAEQEQIYDLIFIDAEKEDYVSYINLCKRLVRSGSIILSDNLLKNGKVFDPNYSETRYKLLAQFNELIASDPMLTSLVIPIINRDIIDGIGISIVN